MRSAPLRLYADYVSQPCRAVLIFSRRNNLPVELKPVIILKGETRSPAYLAINPLGKVPLLEDPGAPASPIDGGVVFRLPESPAIMSYLSSRFPEQVSEHWYPRSDLVHRAQVEAALHWYHGNIRAGAMRVVYNKVVAGLLGRPADERLAAHGLEILQIALSGLQDNWLAKGSRPFMTGPQPSAADLLCACELEQLAMLRPADHGGLSFEQILAPYGIVRAWLQRVRDYCQPDYGQAHEMLLRAAGRPASFLSEVALPAPDSKL